MNRNSHSLLSIVLILAAAIFAGCGGAKLADADKAKAKLQYKDAAEIYKKVASDKSLTKEEQKRARESAAECYRMANEYAKASAAYDKVLVKDPKNTDALFYSGVMQMKLAEKGGTDGAEALRKAREYFKKYLQEVPNDPMVMKKVAGIDSAEAWKTQPSRFKVTNMKVINTKNSDYSPMVGSKKDDVLFFSSDREGGISKKPYGWTGFWYSDIWSVKQKKAKKGAAPTWEKPAVVLGTVNSKFNDGTTTFDRKFSTMYYTQCNGENGKEKNCKIFEASLKGNEWTDIKMLEFCANDTFNYMHPALNEDGTKLYFTSDRDDGQGSHDIWVVNYVKRAKTWSEPINLGPVINTDKDEQFPYWNSHDQNLYFSSNGHLGMGSLDIFRSEGSGNEWSEPENLKSPLNSGGDDFGITFDINKKDHGYFTSNRQDGRGSDDIYEFNISPLIIKIEGIVTDCNKKTPLKNSLVVLTNDKDTSKIILKTDDKGYYSTELNEKRNYEIACSNRELYYFDAQSVQRTTVGIKNSVTLKQDFCLVSQIIERPYPIYYDLDKANIRPDAAKILDEEILPLLTKYPKLRVELGSHTDCRSSYDYNIDLSQRRADSAVAYLVRKGIDPRRIVAKGYGESQLVNDCQCEGSVKVPCSEEQHQQNRRTVIKTLDVDFDPSVKFVPSTDENNRNEKPIILKLKKVGSALTTTTVANGVENTTPSTVAPGEDIQISLAELKTLVIDKKVVKMTDVTGMTSADIIAGKLKPGAAVKLSTLRLGSKDNGKTLTNVTAKIAAIPTPYVLGYNALKAQGGTVNVDESELKFTNVNSAALKDGPVDSKVLDPGKDKPAGSTTPTAPVADTVNLDGYVKINLMTSGSNRTVATMLNDKENITWIVNLASNKTEIDQETAKRLYETGVIKKEDFEDGESIKIDGVKMRSNVFIIQKLEIGGVVAEKVKVTISDKVSEPTLGKTVWRKLNPVDKGNALYVKPKPAKKSATPDKED